MIHVIGKCVFTTPDYNSKNDTFKPIELGSTTYFTFTDLISALQSEINSIEFLKLHGCSDNIDYDKKIHELNILIGYYVFLRDKFLGGVDNEKKA